MFNKQPSATCLQVVLLAKHARLTKPKALEQKRGRKEGKIVNLRIFWVILRIFDVGRFGVSYVFANSGYFLKTMELGMMYAESILKDMMAHLNATLFASSILEVQLSELKLETLGIGESWVGFEVVSTIFDIFSPCFNIFLLYLRGTLSIDVIYSFRGIFHHQVTLRF